MAVHIIALHNLGDFTRIVGVNRGTENVNVRDFQHFLRRNINDGSAIESYREGASTANQRIES